MKQGSPNKTALGERALRVLRTFRAATVRFLARRPPAVCFVLFLFFGVLTFFFCVMAGGESTFLGIFHAQGDTLFSDFFRSVRDAATGSAVYSERRVIYPPLANALFWLISRVMPSVYLEAPAAQWSAWHSYPAAVLSVCLFLCLSLVLFVEVLRREPHPRPLRLLLALFLAVSFPVLFLIERGNLVLLCLAALIVYSQNYGSESAVAREVGLFALAVATALKIYPLLFGLPLLGERRWRDAAHAAIYAFLLFLIPSFFFGGPLFCAGWLVKNTLYYSGYAGRGAISLFAAWGIPATLARAVIYALYAALLLFLILSALLPRRPWKTWAFCAAALLAVPSVFSAYNWVLMLPALLAFLRTERLVGRNILWFFLMATPFFVFVPKVYQDNGLIALIGGIIALSLLESVVLLRRGNRENARKRGKKPYYTL
ncbi:MAG: DUF2029 domain-containing protein [Clostridia bacterium]|nr:DUF2029 domain-containing protein [Clostridia bacterium]